MEKSRFTVSDFALTHVIAYPCSGAGATSFLLEETNDELINQCRGVTIWFLCLVRDNRL